MTLGESDPPLAAAAASSCAALSSSAAEVAAAVTGASACGLGAFLGAEAEAAGCRREAEARFDSTVGLVDAAPRAK